MAAEQAHVMLLLQDLVVQRRPAELQTNPFNLFNIRVHGKVCSDFSPDTVHLPFTIIYRSIKQYLAQASKITLAATVVSYAMLC
jgi:hypothetical protein